MNEVKLNAPDDIVEKIVGLGFHEEIAKMALTLTSNNMDEAIEHLIKLQDDNKYTDILNNLQSMLQASNDGAGPSSSNSVPGVTDEETKQKLEKIKDKMEEQMKVS